VFINETIKEEMNKAMEMLDKSGRILSETKQSFEKLNELNREFCTFGVRSINQLCEKDYTEEKPTGRTKNAKRFDTALNILNIFLLHKVKHPAKRCTSAKLN
jgi:hypothetical protein